MAPSTSTLMVTKVVAIGEGSPDLSTITLSASPLTGIELKQTLVPLLDVVTGFTAGGVQSIQLDRGLLSP
jgi:hypothetical protein